MQQIVLTMNNKTEENLVKDTKVCNYGSEKKKNAVRLFQMIDMQERAISINQFVFISALHYVINTRS